MEYRMPGQPGVYTQVPTAEQPVLQQPTSQYGTVFVHTTARPVPSQRQEVWYSSSIFGNDYSIEQPDPGRIVLGGSRSRYTGFVVRYTYADQLPCMIQASIICTVIFSILATPVTLLCCIPQILSMKVVSLSRQPIT